MTWWYVALAVALGCLAMAWLRSGRHRYPDDQTALLVPPACVPVLSGLAVLPGALHADVASPVVAVTYVLAVVWALLIVAIDLEVARVPDLLTLPAYPVVAVLLTVCSVVTQDGAALGRAAVCAGVSFGLFLLSHVSLGSAGPGFGDVKMAGVVGALLGWISWSASVSALGLTLALCWAFLGVVMLTLRARRGTRSIQLVVVAPALVLSGYSVGLHAALS